MNRKNISKILLSIIILSMLAFITLVAAESSDSDRSYSIDNAIKNINISPNGTSHIQEELHYTFNGTYRGIYRDIPLSGQQSVENITVETPGLYNTVKVENNTNNIHIVVYLYKDQAKTQPVSNQNSKIIYNYDFLKGIKVYNDIAEFQYMSWGPEWEVGVANLQTTITLPGNGEQTEKWINPPFKAIDSNWITANTLQTNIKNLDSSESIEQRILIPKTYFEENASNIDRINKDAKTQIEKDQTNYQNKLNSHQFISVLITIMSILALISPLLIYYQYGREPKISYNSKYETDTPSNDPPEFINALMQRNVWNLDVNAFQASMLNLMDMGYIKVISKVGDDTLIKLTNKDRINLRNSENELLGYFENYTNDNEVISIRKLADTQDPEKFQKFYDIWKNDTKIELFSENKKEKLFHNKGAELFSKLVIVEILYCIVIAYIVLSFSTWVPNATLAIELTLLLIPQIILLLVLPNKIGGQWTPEGKELHDKWKGFEKYIKDYSLIKEHPPASIQVWGKYLVYATALGEADKVNKNMKKFMQYAGIPSEEMQMSNATLFTYYGGNIFLYNTFYNASVYTPESDISDFGGSFGDIGGPGSGGFGGGGGGAF